MNVPRRRLAAVLAVIAVVLGVIAGMAACGGPAPIYAGNSPLTPTAYYVTTGGHNYCYYADDIDEVAALESAGLCPPGSTAQAMPLTWRETYWAYYSSAAYYNTYIPVAYQSHYSTVYVVNFNKQYGSQISAAEKNATYKDASGKTYKGSQIPTAKMTFGGGNARVVSTFGGGNARVTATAPRAVPAPAATTKKPTFGSGNARPTPGKVVPR